MNRFLSLFILGLFAVPGLAQRGAIPLNDLSGIIQPAPFNALVIGISDYSSKSLKLKYARRDAEQFAEFLNRSGWSDTVVTLFDEEATATAIYESINNLINAAAEGEDIYIYFAGHGDKLDLGRRSKAFLLAYDASDSRNYLGAGGVIDLQNLELDINDLISETGSRVFLIIDACHSGFEPLEGSGSTQQLFTENFRVANKLLSCQPDQVSFEDDHIQQGVFTYHLIRGLSGLADQPANGQITIQEISDYLQGMVPTTAPGPQNPVVLSIDSSQVIGPVSRTLLAEVSAGQQLALGGGKRSAGTSGPDDEIPEEIVNLVGQFNQAMNLSLYYGEGPSCLNLIRQAEGMGSFPDLLLKRMKNLLAGQLLVSAQLSINTVLRGKVQLPPAEYYRQQAEHLRVCLDIMQATDRQRHAALISSLYLEAYSIVRARQFEKYEYAMRLLDSAIGTETQAAYLYHTKGQIHAYRDEHDSAIYYYNKALELIPNWLFPMNAKGNALRHANRYEEAIRVYKQVIALDSGFSWSYNNLANVYLDMERYGEAEFFYRETLRHNPEDSAMVFHNLGILYRNRGNLVKARYYLEESMRCDSTYVDAYTSLGEFFDDELDKGDSATLLYLKAAEIQPFYAESYTKRADFYRFHTLSPSDVLLADSIYRYSIQLNPYNTWTWFGYAYLLQDDADAPGSADSVVRECGVWNRHKADYWYELGRYQSWYGTPDSALKCYKRSLELDSFSRDTYRKIARHYAATDPDETIRIMQKYIATNPSNPEAWGDLADFYYYLGRIEDSRKAYLEALKQDSSYTKAGLSLSILLLDEGRVAESIRWYTETQKANPSALDISEYLSYAEKKIGDTVARDRRYEATQLIREFDPWSVRLIVNALRYAYRSGQNAIAIPEADSLLLLEVTIPPEKSRMAYYLCLHALEREDAESRDRYYALYLQNTEEPDPFLQAVMLSLKGDTAEAYKLKARQESPPDPARYGTRFMNLYQSIAE